MATLKTTVLSQLANKVFKDRPARLQQEFFAACQSSEELVCFAAVEKHWKKIRKLARKGADVNARTQDGDTALILLSRNGFGNAVEWMLKLGVDTAPANNKGETALLAAAARGSAFAVDALLYAGADVDATDKDGNNALALYIRANIEADPKSSYARDLRKTLRALIDNGLELDAGLKVELYHKPHLADAIRDLSAVKELVEAARAGNTHQVNELLYWGVPADEPAIKFKDISPLAASAEAGKLDVMELLIAKGAKIDLVSPKTNMTPLQHAARGGCKEAFDRLIDHGALPDHSANLIELARESGVSGMAGHVFDRMMDMGVITTSSASNAAMKPLRFKKPSATV